jgi:hypothetical protein
MILCEWDASEGHTGQSCVHLYAHILSTSFISVSIFSVWCYSSVLYLNGVNPYSEHAVACEYNENNRNKAKKPDRKPDSTLVLKNLTKKIRETETLKSTRVYS